MHIKVLSPQLITNSRHSTQGDQIEMAWKESLTVGGCCQIETNDQYIQVMTFMSYLWHNTGNTEREARKTLFLPLYEICVRDSNRKWHRLQNCVQS